MYFDTTCYYIPYNLAYYPAQWKLWFIEEDITLKRHPVIHCITLPVKPTKKQIRKLRRQFRKDNPSNLDEFFDKEGLAVMRW